MIDTKVAIQGLVERFPNSVFVSICGYITRDLLAVSDRSKNFYLVGSMGMALPIGLGISLAKPESHVVVLDGDGSFKMNLGAAMLVGEHRPRLMHAVLDNGMHESTGGQSTVPFVEFQSLGFGLGYDSVHIVSEAGSDLRLEEDRPVLVRYVCAPRTSAAGPRLALTPEQLVVRFSNAIRDWVTE